MEDVRSILGAPTRGEESNQWVYERHAADGAWMELYFVQFKAGRVSGFSQSRYRPPS